MTGLSESYCIYHLKLATYILMVWWKTYDENFVNAGAYACSYQIQ